MSKAFPKIRVGEPVRHQSLSLFPLFTDTESDLEYQLADEAIAQESLLVEEVNEGGSVPELLVENKSGSRILFLEGEELIGAKQNRILNTSILVAANSKIKVPVSCVEQGRWSYHSRQFSSSGHHSPSKLRHSLKASVSESLSAGEGHRSDQGRVWQEVEEMTTKHGSVAPTMAMSDTFTAQETNVEDFRKNLPFVEGANGMAIVVGNRVVSVDVFDKPATCQKVWSRLISGPILDALLHESGEDVPTREKVEEWVHSAGSYPWEEVAPVGEGEELRAHVETGEEGSALMYAGTLVHGSVIAKS